MSTKEEVLTLEEHESREYARQNEARLLELEKQFEVRTTLRGNTLKITGESDGVEAAAGVVREVRSMEQAGRELNKQEFRHVVRELRLRPRDESSDSKQPGAPLSEIFLDGIAVPLKRRRLSPITGGQKRYLDAIRQKDIVFGIGPAGTGKTYLAVAMAVSHLMSNRVSRIILCRPAVEAGERLGFLPGDLKEKLDPYVRPLYDALYEMMEGEKITAALGAGVIEIAPLAFMRGRTLNNAFVILDEAQNTTPEQMKMFLTRLGFESKAVVTGDVTQIDLPSSQKSGLAEVEKILGHIEDIGIVHFNEQDVVRHELVMKIVQAYEKFDATPKQKR